MQNVEDKTLASAALFVFLVAVTGQWLLGCYVINSYENKNTQLSHQVVDFKVPDMYSIKSKLTQYFCRL